MRMKRDVTTRAFATLSDHLGGQFADREDANETAKDILRNSYDPTEEAYFALQELVLDSIEHDEVHEFHAASLDDIASEYGIDKVLEVRVGEKPGRNEYDHRPHVTVYEMSVTTATTSTTVLIGNVRRGAEGEEQGWIDYPLDVAREDINRIVDDMQQKSPTLNVERGIDVVVNETNLDDAQFY